MLLRPADQLPVFIPTGFPVGMGVLAAEYRFFRLNGGASLAVGVFFLSADQLPGVHRLRHRLKAGVGVLMLQNLGLSAYQIAVSVKAAVSVLVCLNLGKRTPEIPVFVIAAGIMAVNHKIGIPARRISVGIIAVRRVLMNFQRLCAAHGNPFLNRRHLRIAGVRVGVLRDVTLLFQCDSRQNQRIGGTEYHHTGKHGHYPMPEALPFMHLRVFFRIPQNILPHIPSPSFLSQRAEVRQRPDPEYDPSDDLLIGNAADCGTAGIHRGGTVITHTEVTVIRHLIRQRNVTFSKRFFRQVRFLQQPSVHGYISVFVDIHPLAGAGNTALHQNLVSQVERHQVAGFKARALDGEDNIPLIQRGRHGRPIDLQHGHPNGSNQHGYSRNNHKRVDGAAKNAFIPPFVFFSAKLRLQLF